MSDYVAEKADPAIRFVHGNPQAVEAELHRVADTYACQNIYFYVINNHLEVAATLFHVREIRKLQLMQGQVPPGLKLRPN